MEGILRNYRTRGVVLKSFDFGEADRIITIYSETKGKIKAVAKGVRRTKSRFGGRLEPFTYVDLLLVRGRNLDTITGADIICPFSGIKLDLDKTACGFAIVDLLDKIAAGTEPDLKVFYLLLNTLELLDRGATETGALLAAFDLKIMCLSGYLPELTVCGFCKDSELETGSLFSFERGTMVCPSCAGQAGTAKKTGAETLDFLRSVVSSEMTEVAPVELSAGARNESIAWVRDYVDYYLGARLKSREYLQKIEGEKSS
ncbi:MAG: DNA repair protein RecO [Terriglobia bacterium]